MAVPFIQAGYDRAQNRVQQDTATAALWAQARPKLMAGQYESLTQEEYDLVLAYSQEMVNAAHAPPVKQQEPAKPTPAGPLIVTLLAEDQQHEDTDTIEILGPELFVEDINLLEDKTDVTLNLTEPQQNFFAAISSPTSIADNNIQITEEQAQEFIQARDFLVWHCDQVSQNKAAVWTEARFKLRTGQYESFTEEEYNLALGYSQHILNEKKISGIKFEESETDVTLVLAKPYQDLFDALSAGTLSDQIDVQHVLKLRRAYDFLTWHCAQVARMRAIYRKYLTLRESDPIRASRILLDLDLKNPWTYTQEDLTNAYEINLFWLNQYFYLIDGFGQFPLFETNEVKMAAVTDPAASYAYALEHDHALSEAFTLLKEDIPQRDAYANYVEYRDYLAQCVSTPADSFRASLILLGLPEGTQNVSPQDFENCVAHYQPFLDKQISEEDTQAIQSQNAIRAACQFLSENPNAAEARRNPSSAKDLNFYIESAQEIRKLQILENKVKSNLQKIQTVLVDCDRVARATEAKAKKIEAIQANIESLERISSYKRTLEISDKEAKKILNGLDTPLGLDKTEWGFSALSISGLTEKIQQLRREFLMHQTQLETLYQKLTNITTENISAEEEAFLSNFTSREPENLAKASQISQQMAEAKGYAQQNNEAQQDIQSLKTYLEHFDDLIALFKIQLKIIHNERLWDNYVIAKANNEGKNKKDVTLAWFRNGLDRFETDPRIGLSREFIDDFTKCARIISDLESRILYEEVTPAEFALLAKYDKGGDSSSGSRENGDETVALRQKFAQILQERAIEVPNKLKVEKERFYAEYNPLIDRLGLNRIENKLRINARDFPGDAKDRLEKIDEIIEPLEQETLSQVALENIKRGLTLVEKAERDIKNYQDASELFYAEFDEDLIVRQNPAMVQRAVQIKKAKGEQKERQEEFKQDLKKRKETLRKMQNIFETLAAIEAKVQAASAVTLTVEGNDDDVDGNTALETIKKALLLIDDNLALLEEDGKAQKNSAEEALKHMQDSEDMMSLVEKMIDRWLPKTTVELTEEEHSFLVACADREDEEDKLKGRAQEVITTITRLAEIGAKKNVLNLHLAAQREKLADIKRTCQIDWQAARQAYENAGKNKPLPTHMQEKFSRREYDGLLATEFRLMYEHSLLMLGQDLSKPFSVEDFVKLTHAEKSAYGIFIQKNQEEKLKPLRDAIGNAVGFLRHYFYNYLQRTVLQNQAALKNYVASLTPGAATVNDHIKAACLILGFDDAEKITLSMIGQKLEHYRLFLEINFASDQAEFQFAQKDLRHAVEFLQKNVELIPGNIKIRQKEYQELRILHKKQLGLADDQVLNEAIITHAAQSRRDAEPEHEAKPQVVRQINGAESFLLNDLKNLDTTLRAIFNAVSEKSVAIRGIHVELVGFKERNPPRLKKDQKSKSDETKSDIDTGPNKAEAQSDVDTKPNKAEAQSRGTLTKIDEQLTEIVQSITSSSKNPEVFSESDLIPQTISVTELSQAIAKLKNPSHKTGNIDFAEVATVLTSLSKLNVELVVLDESLNENISPGDEAFLNQFQACGDPKIERCVKQIHELHDATKKIVTTLKTEVNQRKNSLQGLLTACEERWEAQAVQELENYQKNIGIFGIFYKDEKRLESVSNFKKVVDKLNNKTARAVYTVTQRIDILLAYVASEKAYVLKKHQEGGYLASWGLTSSRLYHLLEAQEASLRKLRGEVAQATPVAKAPATLTEQTPTTATAVAPTTTSSASPSVVAVNASNDLVATSVAAESTVATAGTDDDAFNTAATAADEIKSNASTVGDDAEGAPDAIVEDNDAASTSSSKAATEITEITPNVTSTAGVANKNIPPTPVKKESASTLLFRTFVKRVGLQLAHYDELEPTSDETLPAPATTAVRPDNK